MKMTNTQDYSKVKTDYLVAVCPTNLRRNRAVLWKFRCICGNEKVISPRDVISGRIKSCGCATSYLVNKRKRLPEGEAAFRQMYRSYRQAATLRGFVFGLSQDEFKSLTKQDCYYCGIRPQQSYEIKANDTAPYIYNGVDRLNSSNGYVLGNVVPCCGFCNRMKMDSNLEEFLSKIKSIFQKHSYTTMLLESQI